MAEEGNVISDLNLDSAANGEDTGPAAGIISQYIKDLSVENPNAPQCFQWEDAPQLDVQFNIAAQRVDGDIHEVELKIVATAKAEGGTAYAVDLAYAALVGMRNLDDNTAHSFLFAEAPRILFPFARRIISEAVRDAGFAPLMLDPIDFNGLYMQQLAAQQEAEQSTEAGQGEPAGNA
ncbi:MAG: protein-export chaperone SecB [Sphingomonadaceae bacterium]|nr:protein-export chaperone SecB [Sphingomonadaceae bacterium]